LIRLIAAAVVITAVFLLPGCASSDADQSSTLNVFAASSLTTAFEAMAPAFEDAHPSVEVQLSFGGSGGLARQISDGANADVFASADEVAMQAVEDDVEEPVVFTRNRLTIVVEPGNPKKIGGLSDLGDDVVVVLCSPNVPCGRYADDLLTRARVRVEAASMEENVKGVVAKVSLGEADAGIVYVTDAIAAGDRVETVDIATDAELDASYPIAVLEGSGDEDAAEEWVRFTLSAAGQKILRDHGFLAP
jgi:molybdate transport system substrate-binding protein